MKCFFDLPPAVRRDLVDFKDGVARQFWMGRVENEFFMKGVSRCHCLLGFVYNMRTHRLVQNLPFFFPERTLKEPNWGFLHIPAKNPIIGEMFDCMPFFKMLLDSGQDTMDELCRRFSGFYHYAKILETLAAGIQSGEIQVPK
jgi:hypothetical protein